jgi:hypothetical protein
LLDRQVSRRQAWASRLAADVAAAASGLWQGTSRLEASEAPERPGARGTSGAGGTWGEVALPEVTMGRPLARALEQAAGVPLVIEAVAKAHRHRSVAATGWPVTRWLRRLRPDPLRRLHLSRGGGRTSLPQASAVQVSAVETALRDVGAAASAGVPEPWATAVRHAARSREGELTGALDRTVASGSLGASRAPRWWRVAGTLQWLTVVAMAAGGLWLLALFALRSLLLPEPLTPTLDRVPWPTVLLVGGAMAGLLLAALCRVVAWLGGRRRARGAAKALRAGITRVGEDLVIAPTREELARYSRFVERVSVAGS